MFVFRNNTIENLFPSDTKFSGYGDISDIPKDEKTLVWFYQAPLNFDLPKKVSEINSLIEKLKLLTLGLSSDQTLYVCSLIDMFPVRGVDSDSSLEKAIYSFNEEAGVLSLTNPNIRFIDVAEYFSQFPSDEWVNWKFYFLSQMIVSPKVASGFHRWFEKKLAVIKGYRKKCLVLDLDNTLWGGVIGEDGLDGIKIGGDYPGNAFLYFQEALIELSKQGVVLAICSKNNEQEIFDAWKHNPFIKLNHKYISAYRINWNNKADNIRELAKELNIGLDSMVFLDDNPAERELVRTELPMVSVPDFPKQPYGLMTLYKELVNEYFRIYQLTDEDKNKTVHYKANAQRKAESSKFTNIEDYIKSLNIELDLMAADHFNIPRIAQMTQKTNQFNLTTKRYTETDIFDFIDRGDLVYCLSVRDRFGDNGITGVAIVKKENDYTAGIDSFLLSCRILGKGIENVFFKKLVNLLREKGFSNLEAKFLPTEKNIQTADFYDRNDMSLIYEDQNEKRYQMKIDRELVLPDYYKIKEYL